MFWIPWGSIKRILLTIITNFFLGLPLRIVRYTIFGIVVYLIGLDEVRRYLHLVFYPGFIFVGMAAGMFSVLWVETWIESVVAGSFSIFLYCLVGKIFITADWGYLIWSGFGSACLIPYGLYWGRRWRIKIRIIQMLGWVRKSAIRWKKVPVRLW